MKKNLILAVCFCLLMGGVAMADSLVFKLSNWKDDGAIANIKNLYGEDALDAFQFVFTDAENGKAALTFEINDIGVDINIGGGDAGLKFKDFVLTGFAGVFTTDNKGNIILSGWDNGGWTPTTATLQFATGMTWDSFYEGVDSGNITGTVQAHIQSIGSDGKSINGGMFTFAPEGDFSGGPEDPCDTPGVCDDPSAVPEPGSILLLGTGVIGLGFAARRKLCKI